MASSSAWFSLVWVALFALVAHPGAEGRKAALDKPCSKDYIREMVIAVCGRHKRSLTVSGTEKQESAPSLIFGEKQEGFLKHLQSSSLDTLLDDIMIAESYMPYAHEGEDLERFVRAEKTITHCCRNVCSLNDFIGAC